MFMTSHNGVGISTIRRCQQVVSYLRRSVCVLAVAGKQREWGRSTRCTITYVILFKKCSFLARVTFCANRQLGSKPSAW